MPLWQETCQWHPKMLNLQQKCNGLERKLFWTKWDKMSLYLTILIEICNVVKQWTSRCSISSTTLPSMTFLSKYGWFTCIQQTKPDWPPSFGHNLLRPTSNNLKYTPWDPLVFGFLSVQGPAWFLTCSPPGVWAMCAPGVCMRIPSVAAPILLDNDQLWTLLV